MMVYVNDVIILSKSAKKHLQYIQKVLERLRWHGLFIKPKKCKFAEIEVSYLGHIINCTETHTDLIKIQAAAVYPSTTTVTEA